MITDNFTAQELRIADAINEFTDRCHEASYGAGWWHLKEGGFNLDLRAMVRGETNDDEFAVIFRRFAKALVAEKLCLSHGEISEGMEGHRKGLMDDKLPHRSMLEVEIADTFIRLGDLAAALGLDVGSAIIEKMAFNSVRPDHKLENRMAAGGKAY
jgi:hypothetical protein